MFRRALLSVLILPIAAATAQRPDRPASRPSIGPDAPLRVETPLAAAVEAPFPDGARCLFIGHSFFVPVAKSFDRIARKSGFDDHRVRAVFAPGTKGSAGSLWQDRRRRDQIERQLATGKVELLGMTVAGVRGSSVDDYRRWIDLALEHNPTAQVMIGVCWAPGGPRTDTERYARAVDRAAGRPFATVEELRRLYPETPIHLVHYGSAASLLKARFESGALPGIEELTGRGAQALFADRWMGHGGPILLDVAAVSWLRLLYGADLDRLEGVRHDATVVREVTDAMVEANARYR